MVILAKDDALVHSKNNAIILIRATQKLLNKDFELGKTFKSKP